MASISRATTISPASTASCATAARRWRATSLPKLPPDYQPLANARLAMATKAADAPTILKGVSAAKLNEPGIKLERLAWLRKSGNFDEAKALAAAPPPARPKPGGTSASSWRATCWPPAMPPTPMPSPCSTARRAGIAFAEAEFLAGWIALRHLKKPADGAEALPDAL